MFCTDQRNSHEPNPVVKVGNIEQVANDTPISLLPEEVLRNHVLSLLELIEVVRLDSAFTNRSLRKYFLATLKDSNLIGVADFRHLDWFKVRKCSARTLRVTSSLNDRSMYDYLTDFKELEVCATANVPTNALCRMLTGGTEFRTLNVPAFRMHLHQLLPLDVDLPLLEINASGNIYLSEDVLVALVKRCPLLRVINVKRSLNWTQRLLQALAEHCPRLNKMLFVTCDHYMDASVAYSTLFQRCRQLQVVDCSGAFTISNFRTLAEFCIGLTSLKLRCHNRHNWEELHGKMYTEEADAALVTLVRNNPNIHSLKLKSFPPFTHDSLSAVARFLPNLRTFCLDSCQASLTGLADIRTSCTALTRFEAYDNQSFYWFNQTLVYSYLQLSILSTLHIESTTLSDAQLVTIAQTNPNMHTLRIESQGTLPNATRLSATAICSALSHLHHLEMLNVGAYLAYQYSPESLLAIDDSVIYALVEHCPKLTILYMSGHANISNEALSALSNLPLLQTVDVCLCKNLLDNSVAAIAQGCLCLEGVFLSHCPHITNVGINALARHCRKLTSMELQRCRGIHDNDIQNLIHRARHLEKLDISLIPHLTFAAVAELPHYCFCMREVCLFWSKPDTMDANESYQQNKHYFDVVFGWSNDA